MIDTVKLFSKNINEIDLEYLENKYGLTTFSAKRYERKCINIENFKLNVDNYGIHLQGSAPLFLRNNNIQTLKHHEIQDFITKLSDAMNLNVSNYTITRLDITENIETKYHPKIYKKHFGTCKYFQKVDYEFNGLQYINSVRHLTLYDKIIEQNNKIILIPNEYSDKNLLRFEYSIMKNNRFHLGESIKNINDLRIQENYLALIDKYEKMYNQIEKICDQPINRTSMDFRPGLKPRDYLALLGAHSIGGLSNAMAFIKELADKEYCSPRIARTVNFNLKNSQSQYNSLQVEKEDTLDELNSKFKQKIQDNRQAV